MALITFNEKVEDNTTNRFKVHKSKGYKGVSLLLEPSPKQWFEDPDALVAFNIPRISARLERLMGTNVVRLTDRKYMRELRERIDEDYRVQLSNRIKTREIKELERERNLILTGKTDTIPDELAVDPIFVVNKRANIEIEKRRANLKTNREKNADRLERQGLKWERERLKHEEQQHLKQMQLAQIRKEQLALEEKYKAEDAKRGLDLLRINDTEWQDCEQSLRDFLKSERDKMKERSWRIPTQFASDPLDLRNVIRARKLLREEQRRRRLEELRLAREAAKSKPTKKKVFKKVSNVNAAAKQLAAGADQGDQESYVSVYLDDDEASGIPSTSSEIQKAARPLPDIKLVKTKEMEAQMDADVEKGYLVTKDQYANLRYADPQIEKLQKQPDIRGLYQIAEKIIICDMEEEPVGGEEMEIEDEDND